MTKQAIGIIVPPGNPAVEPEMRRLIPGDIDFYVARLPRAAGTLQERLAFYGRVLPQTAHELADLPLDITISACTGCSYEGTLVDDAWSTSQMEAELGSPAITAAGAINTVLRALNATSVSLVSPYPDWLTQQAESFWSRVGFTVASVVPISGTGKIYDLPEARVAEVIQGQLSAPESKTARHVILVTGTGARSLRALESLAAQSSIPVVSSNLASAWAALEKIGGETTISHAHNPALSALDAHIRQNL